MGAIFDGVKAGLSLGQEWNDRSFVNATRNDAWEQQRLQRENNAQRSQGYLDSLEELRPLVAPQPMAGIEGAPAGRVADATPRTAGGRSIAATTSPLETAPRQLSLSAQEWQSLFGAHRTRRVVAQEITPELRDQLQRGQQYGQLYIEAETDQTGATVAYNVRERQGARTELRAQLSRRQHATDAFPFAYARAQPIRETELVQRAVGPDPTSSVNFPGTNQPTANPHALSVDTRNSQQFTQLLQDLGLPPEAISSSHRSVEENNALPDSAPNSRHIEGNALDISPGYLGAEFTANNLAEGKAEVERRLAAAGYTGYEVIGRRHGTAPHIHVEWGDGGDSTPGTSEELPAEADEGVQLAFQALTNGTTTPNRAVQQAGWLIDTLMEQAEISFSNGQLEGGMELMGQVMQAEGGLRLAEQMQALAMFRNAGNGGAISNIMAEFLGIEPGQYAVQLTDDGYVRELFRTDTGVQGEDLGQGWVGGEVYDPVSFGSAFMSAVNAEYMQNMQAAQAELQQAMIRMQQAVQVAQISGEYDLAEAGLVAGAANERALLDAQVRTNLGRGVVDLGEGAGIVVDNPGAPLEFYSRQTTRLPNDRGQNRSGPLRWGRQG